MTDAERLMEKLVEYEDLESAVAIYLEAHSLQNALDDVKRVAKGWVEQYLASTGEIEYSCKAGKAKLTNPRTARLDRKSWSAAVAADRNLADVQFAYDAASANLDKAQEPFKVLPEPTLRITG